MAIKALLSHPRFVVILKDLLFDLMIYPEGPRVRDKVSHGEANLQDIPESLALAVLVAVVMVMRKCSKFTTSNEVGSYYFVVYVKI